MTIPKTSLRIGTRGSPLALAQAHETRNRLAAACGLDPTALEIVVITTTGDRISDRPLNDIGGKGLFTKEIEEALLSGAIDLAVHSMKDMPAVVPRGLSFAATLPREDARDALVCKVSVEIDDLPPSAHVGSSSVRRSAQMLRRRPDLVMRPMRGNVGTRLQKLEDGHVDATILACAGLNRLGIKSSLVTPIAVEFMLPAIAQGAIGIEIRSGDERTGRLVSAIDHGPTSTAVACERAFLAALDGSCRTPIAGHAQIENGRISFRGETLTPDGKKVFTASREGAASDAARLGTDAAAEIIANGGSLIATT